MVSLNDITNTNNLNWPWPLEVARPADAAQTTQPGDDITTIQDDYQELTGKEESDLGQLMSECKIAISNAEAFADQLSKQLSVLDGVCLCTWYLTCSKMADGSPLIWF